VRYQRGGQAFVEYAQPDSAEVAIATMNRKDLLGRTIFCSWARATKRGGEATTTSERHGVDGPFAFASSSSSRAAASSSAAAAAAAGPPLPPPGGSSGKGPVKKKPVPKGFSVKLAPEVAGRTGGGPVKGVGTAAAQRAAGPAKPYYPSSDPKRLGSKAT
jgi:RNA recognition motif-containing protein